LQIPIERLATASAWRDAHIPVLSHVGMDKVNKALSKLTKWVLLFNRMISFYSCATDDENATAIMATIKEKHVAKMRAQEEAEAEILRIQAEKNAKKVSRSSSKASLSRGDSKKHLSRGNSKVNLSRGLSKTRLIGASSGVLDTAQEEFDPSANVDMHELITRTNSKTFSSISENEDTISHIDFKAAALEYEKEEKHVDPILGKRRVSVIAKIAGAGSHRPSVGGAADGTLQGEGKDENFKTISQSVSCESADTVDSASTSNAPDVEPSKFEAQFWKSIGAAFMLDDKDQIILSNGKDIALYRDMLLRDETVTSDYSKCKLSGGDLALGTRRRKIVAENREMINSFVGKMIKQVSSEFFSVSGDAAPGSAQSNR
jgi:hypothetical protein